MSVQNGIQGRPNLRELAQLHLKEMYKKNDANTEICKLVERILSTVETEKHTTLPSLVGATPPESHDSSSNSTFRSLTGTPSSENTRASPSTSPLSSTPSSTVPQSNEATSSALPVSTHAAHATPNSSTVPQVDEDNQPSRPAAPGHSQSADQPPRLGAEVFRYVNPIIREQAAIPEKYMDARKRLTETPSAVPEVRERVSEQFGTETTEFLERYSLTLAKDIKSVADGYGGVIAPEECAYGVLPGMSWTNSIAWALFKKPCEIAGSWTKEWNGAAVSAKSTASLGRILSDVLVVVVDKVGKKIADKLDNQAEEIEGRATKKLELLHELSDEMASFFTNFADARRKVELGTETNFCNAVCDEFKSAQKEKGTDYQAMVQVVQDKPVASAQTYDQALAEILVDKLLPDILGALPNDWSTLGLLRLTQKNEYTKTEFKNQIVSLLTQILGSVRHSAMDETALRGYLSSALDGVTAALENAGVGKGKASESLDQAHKVVSDLPAKPNLSKDRGIASLIQSFSTLVLGLKPSGFLTKHLLDSVYLKSVINNGVETAIRKGLKHEDKSSVSVAHILENLFRVLNDTTIKPDGYMDFQPIATRCENPRLIQSSEWSEKDEDSKRAFWKKRHIESAQQQQEGADIDKKVMVDKMKSSIAKAAHKLADVALSPERFFTGSLYTHYHKVWADDFTDNQEIDQKAKVSGESLKALVAKCSWSKCLPTDQDYTSLCKSAFVALKRADRYATTFFFHAYFTTRIYKVVDCAVHIFKSMRDSVSHKIAKRLDNSLQIELDALVTSPLRHVMYNDVVEKLLINLELLTEDQAKELHRKIINGGDLQ